DKPILIAVVNDREFARFAAAVGRADWAADARFASNNERVRHRTALDALIADRLGEKQAAEWLAALAAASVPSGPVNALPDVFEDAHLKARGAVVELPHPLIGEARTTALPIRLSETPADYRRAAPLTGEHTDEILREFGLDDGEIAALRRAGAIG